MENVFEMSPKRLILVTSIPEDSPGKSKTTSTRLLAVMSAKNEGKDAKEKSQVFLLDVHGKSHSINTKDEVVETAVVHKK